MPSRLSAHAAAAQPPTSAGNSDQSTGIERRLKISSPTVPRKVSPTGTVSTIMPTRTVCDSAVATGSAPNRSPRVSISAIPPGTLPKNAVAGSSRAMRIWISAPTPPSSTAITAAIAIQCTWPRTIVATSGVKRRPMAVPMTICPTCRVPLGQPMRNPARLIPATKTRGPSSHGIGVSSAEKTSPPATAAPSETQLRPIERKAGRTMRAGLVGRGRSGENSRIAGPARPAGRAVHTRIGKRRTGRSTAKSC